MPSARSAGLCPKMPNVVLAADKRILIPNPKLIAHRLFRSRSCVMSRLYKSFNPGVIEPYPVLENDCKLNARSSATRLKYEGIRSVWYNFKMTPSTDSEFNVHHPQPL